MYLYECRCYYAERILKNFQDAIDNFRLGSSAGKSVTFGIRGCLKVTERGPGAESVTINTKRVFTIDEYTMLLFP